MSSIGSVEGYNPLLICSLISEIHLNTPLSLKKALLLVHTRAEQVSDSKFFPLTHTLFKSTTVGFFSASPWVDVSHFEEARTRQE